MRGPHTKQLAPQRTVRCLAGLGISQFGGFISTPAPVVHAILQVQTFARNLVAEQLPCACFKLEAGCSRDGQCRTQILTGSGCGDSACVQSSLLNPELPSGNALQYVRCQQDFCYDSCFNP